MHILLIHQAFKTDKDPGGTRHVELAKHLVQHGHRFTAIGSTINTTTGETFPRCKGHFLTYEKIANRLSVLHAYSTPKARKGFFYRLISFWSFMLSSLIAGLSVHNIDVVVGTSPPIFQGISAYLLSRLKHVPFVFEVRDLWPDFAIDIGILKNPLLIKASKWLESFLYKHADLIIVNSPGFIPHLRKCSVPEEKIKLVPNGTQVDMYKPDDKGEKVRQDLGINNEFVVLYAGAHGQANDLGTLLLAAKKLENYKDIVFVFVGDGGERPKLIQQARNLQLENVHFVPLQPKSSIPSFLAAADVCVATLKNIPMFTTTYPNKVFDYMAAGRPTALAIDGVIREVIENANGGLFAEPGNPQALADNILKLYNDSTLRIQQGENARAYVEAHFDRSDQALKFEAVMKESL